MMSLNAACRTDIVRVKVSYKINTEFICNHIYYAGLDLKKPKFGFKLLKNLLF